MPLNVTDRRGETWLQYRLDRCVPSELRPERHDRTDEYYWHNTPMVERVDTLWQPEAALWRAVLEQAIVDSCEFASGITPPKYMIKSAHEMSVFVDARDWIESKSMVRGGFLWVCSELSISPEYILKGLRPLFDSCEAARMEAGREHPGVPTIATDSQHLGRMRSLIDKDAVIAIRASSLQAKEEARKYRVSQFTIYDIRNRKTWKHVA